MFGIWSLTVSIIEKIHSKPARRSIGSRETRIAHSMTHTQSTFAVTIIIIKQKRTHTILSSVHKTILVNIWLWSYDKKNIKLKI